MIITTIIFIMLATTAFMMMVMRTFYDGDDNYICDDIDNDDDDNDKDNDNNNYTYGNDHNDNDDDDRCIRLPWRQWCRHHGCERSDTAHVVRADPRL